MKRLLAALLILLTLCGCQQAGQQETSDDPLPQQTRKEVSFLAAGDNLFHGMVRARGEPVKAGIRRRIQDLDRAVECRIGRKAQLASAAEDRKSVV